MLVNLVFDLRRRIRHEDTAVRVARAHLSLRPLECWEKFRMEQRWLGVLKFLCNVPRQTEVRVLVDSAGDEAWNIGSLAEYLGKRVGERRRCLDGSKVYFSDIIRVGKSKGGFCLAVCDLARYFGDVLVEWAAHVFVVAEDKRFGHVEAESDDIFGVHPRKLLGLFDLEFMLEKELLIIWNADKKKDTLGNES